MQRLACLISFGLSLILCIGLFFEHPPALFLVAFIVYIRTLERKCIWTPTVGFGHHRSCISAILRFYFEVDWSDLYL